MLHAAATSMIAGLTSLAVLASPTSGRTTDDRSTSTPRALGTTVSAPAAHAAPTRSRPCGAEPTTAAGWQHLFDGLSGSWSGADGASSTRLPDGRLLWVFGDTFVGRVDADGSRAHGTRLVRNSIVVTDGVCVAAAPTTTDALPGRGRTWLWPTHSVVTAAGAPGGSTTVIVFAQRLVRSGSGAYGFRRVGAATVRLTVPWGGSPVVGPVHDLRGSSVLWGAALVRDGATTWVYGTRAVTRPLVFGRELLLARAPTATVADQTTWTYRTSSGWSASSSRARVIRPAEDGVSTVASSVAVNRRYVIVTKPQEFLDDRVVALTSSRPWGPWTSRTLAAAPSTEAVPRYSPGIVAPRPGSGPHFVVVVSQTATTTRRIMADSSATRPVFIDVRLG